MRKVEYSFCEQKEAKKLYPLTRGGRITSPTDEVFLLLFVHKKKTSSALPGILA